MSPRDTEGETEAMSDETLRLLAQLRDAGWMVAVHNDYRLNGQRMTFWLFTREDRRWIKGEGMSDEAALIRAVEDSGGEETLTAFAARLRAAATPPAFRDVLLAIARSCRQVSP